MRLRGIFQNRVIQLVIFIALICLAWVIINQGIGWVSGMADEYMGVYSQEIETKSDVEGTRPSDH